MKLIAEFNDQHLEVLTEEKKDGGKKYVIEGVFAQADQKNSCLLYTSPSPRDS